MKISKVKENFLRGLRLKCPACGRASIYESTWKTKKRCTSCGLNFEPEQGYFVGAVYINAVLTELFLIAIYMICLFTMKLDRNIEYTIFAMAVILPFVLYRYTRGLWLSLDYTINPPK